MRRTGETVLNFFSIRFIIVGVYRTFEVEWVLVAIAVISRETDKSVICVRTSRSRTNKFKPAARSAALNLTRLLNWGVLVAWTWNGENSRSFLCCAWTVVALQTGQAVLLPRHTRVRLKVSSFTRLFNSILTVEPWRTVKCESSNASVASGAELSLTVVERSSAS